MALWIACYVGMSAYVFANVMVRTVDIIDLRFSSLTHTIPRNTCHVTVRTRHKTHELITVSNMTAFSSFNSLRLAGCSIELGAVLEDSCRLRSVHGGPDSLDPHRHAHGRCWYVDRQKRTILLKSIVRATHQEMEE